MGKLNLPLLVTRQVMFWFEPRAHPEAFEVGALPFWMWERGPQDFAYGFPNVGKGFKLGHHQPLDEVDPNGYNQEMTAEDEANVRQWLERTFPDVGGKLLRAETCMYTSTPDAHFLIDIHPKRPNIVLASPCSGHGFKFSAGDRRGSGRLEHVSQDRARPRSVPRGPVRRPTDGGRRLTHDAATSRRRRRGRDRLLLRHAPGRDRPRCPLPHAPRLRRGHGRRLAHDQPPGRHCRSTRPPSSARPKRWPRTDPSTGSWSDSRRPRFPEIPKLLGPLLSQHTRVLAIMNGLTVDDEIAAQLPEGHVAIRRARLHRRDPR